MSKRFATAARRIPDVIRDAAGICAVGSISYGAWLIDEPAGFIVGGSLVLVGVIASAIGKSRSRSV